MAAERRSTVRKDMHFAQIPEWVLFHDELSPQAVRLYGVLARYADRDNQAFPGRRLLATHLHVRSTDTVDRAIKELVDAQAVTVEQRFDQAGDQTSNRYTVHLAPPEGVAARIGNPLPTDAAGGGPAEQEGGGRTAAATVAAGIVHEREPFEVDPLTPTTDDDSDSDDVATTTRVRATCSRHPDAPGANCRGCGTTDRQRQQVADIAAAAKKRADDRAELDRQRRERAAAAAAYDSPKVAAAKAQARQALTGVSRTARTR